MQKLKAVLGFIKRHFAWFVVGMASWFLVYGLVVSEIVRHIVERFILHYVASTFITLAFYFAVRYWRRRNTKVGIWIAPEKPRLLLIAGLCVFALFPLREAFDNAFLLQVWYKAITDDLSWLLGPGTSVWGLYRFDKED